jgi:hypothetical protein
MVGCAQSCSWHRSLQNNQRLGYQRQEESLTVVKHFSERARHSGPSCLLPVDGIQALVDEQSNSPPAAPSRQSCIPKGECEDARVVHPVGRPSGTALLRQVSRIVHDHRDEVDEHHPESGERNLRVSERDSRAEKDSSLY